jgi:hypothetical protein
MVGGGAGALAATGYSRAVPLSNTAATGITISGGRMVYPASGADSAFLAPDFGPDVDFQLVPRSGWTLGDGDAVVVLARGGALGSSGWGAVFLVLIGGATTDTWELREKPVGGSASVLASVSGVSKLGPGDSIELEVIRTHVGAYKVNGGVATQVVAPTTTTISGAGKFGLELAPAAGTLDGIETLLGGTVIPVGNTIYVDRSSAAASDSHTYTQAQDPLTPLATSDAAVAMVQSGDTIRMIDGGGQFPEFVALSPILATNVTVEGPDASTGWHVRRLHLRGVDRWTFRNLITLGDTQGDLSELDGCFNLTFVNWQAQRGGANILAAQGDWLWDGGSVQAPLDGPVVSFLDGVGWRFHYAFDTVNEIGNVEFRDHVFSNVQGEDGCQFLGGAFHVGYLKFTRCYWHDFTQSTESNAPHTDGVQVIGANLVIFDSPKFERVPSMIISSDDFVQELQLLNAYFKGEPVGGYSTQFFGMKHLIARNCTWEQSNFGGLRVGYDSRLDAFSGGVPITPIIDVANCIIDKLAYTEGIDVPANPQAATITQAHNLVGVGPTQATDHQAFAEYGHTASTDLELANSPAGTNVLAIDTGVAHAADALVPLLDRLGRSRKGAGTDLGCHESDPAVSVIVDPRALRVVGFAPVPSAVDVAPSANVSIVLFPKPGETLDASTVSAASFYVTDPGGRHLPVVSVSVGAVDGAGFQTVTIDVDGDLYPYVVYTAVMAATVADTEGSTLTAAETWTFRALGPATPAVYSPTSPPPEPLPDPGQLLPSQLIRYAHGLLGVPSWMAAGALYGRTAPMTLADAQALVAAWLLKED